MPKKLRETTTLLKTASLERQSVALR